MPAPDFDFDEEEHRTRHESPLGLPAPDKLYQRMECAGRLVRRHEEDPLTQLRSKRHINLLLYREQPGWSQATQPADSVVALVTSPFGWNSAFGEPFVQKLLRKPLPRMARVRALWAGLIG